MTYHVILINSVNIPTTDVRTLWQAYLDMGMSCMMSTLQASLGESPVVKVGNPVLIHFKQLMVVTSRPFVLWNVVNMSKQTPTFLFALQPRSHVRTEDEEIYFATIDGSISRAHGCIRCLRYSITGLFCQNFFCFLIMLPNFVNESIHSQFTTSRPHGQYLLIQISYLKKDLFIAIGFR